jgi:hypothetical protein
MHPPSISSSSANGIWRPREEVVASCNGGGGGGGRREVWKKRPLSATRNYDCPTEGDNIKGNRNVLPKESTQVDKGRKALSTKTRSAMLL